jgi:hypothetical protein
MTEAERRAKLKASAARLAAKQPTEDTAATDQPPQEETFMQGFARGMKDNLGMANAAATGASEAVSFGLDDPLAGLINYLTGSAGSVSEGIQQNVANKAAIQEQYPISYGVGSTGADVGLALTGEGLVAKAGQKLLPYAGPAMSWLGRNVAKPFLGAAAPTALSSAGNDLGEGRTPDAIAYDALMSGGTSLLGNAVFSGVPKAVKSAANMLGIGGSNAAKTEAAQALISEAGAFAGKGPRTFDPVTMESTGGFRAGELGQQANEALPNATLADLDPALRNALAAAAGNRRTAPEVLGSLTSVMKGRQDEFGVMVQDGIQQILPDSVSASVHKEGMEAALKPLQAEYDTVLNSATEIMERGDAYSILDDMIPAGTNQAASVKAQLKRVVDRATPALRDADGKVLMDANDEPIRKAMDAREVLALKKQADDLYERLSNEEAGAATKEAARAALNAKNEVSAFLDDAVPGYSDVTAKYAEPLSFNEFRTKGSKAATRKKGTVEDLTDYTSTLKPAELDAFKQGYRDALQAQIERGELSFLRKAEGGNTQEMGRLRVLFGDQVVNDLASFATKMSDMRQTTSTALGAATSSQLGRAGAGPEMAALLSDIGDVATGVVAGGLRALPGAAARRVITTGGKGQRAAVTNQIAKWMTAQGPQQMDDALKEIFGFLNRAEMPPRLLPPSVARQTFGASFGPNERQ